MMSSGSPPSPSIRGAAAARGPRAIAATRSSTVSSHQESTLDSSAINACSMLVFLRVPGAAATRGADERSGASVGERDGHGNRIAHRVCNRREVVSMTDDLVKLLARRIAFDDNFHADRLETHLRGFHLGATCAPR